MHSLEYIDRTLAAIAGGMLISMIGVTAYGVVKRYFLRSPDPWAYELNTILLLWSFLLALPIVEFMDQHIRADILTQFTPQKMQDFLREQISPYLGFFYAILLTATSFQNAYYSLKMGERSMSVTMEPLFPIKILIPICYLICFFSILKKIIAKRGG